MRWVPNYPDVRWLHAGFSQRGGGVSTVYGGESLNLGWTETDAPERVLENRRRLIREIWPAGGCDAPELVTMRQVHSAEVVVIAGNEGARTDESGRTVLCGDGMMTDASGLLLGIQTADCVPVLVADTRRRVVAGFHAGWRGTVGRIVERGLARMGEVYGTRPEDVVAAIGPAIGACCYAVSEDVRASFAGEFRYADVLFEGRQGRPRWELADGVEEGTEAGEGFLYLDLHEANRRQLVQAGVPVEHIDVLGGECTACARDADGARRYFSHRADRGFAGRMMAVIGINAL